MEGTLRVAVTANAPAPAGPYSQAICFGRLVFCSGQLPRSPDGESTGGGTGLQTEQIFNNLEAVLRASKASLASVLKVTVYLVDLDDFNDMNEVYARRFGTHRPARTTVGVSRLGSGALVAIDCIAASDE
jgi:2-iminobutanoate/2-iminopropanoate deaminase